MGRVAPLLHMIVMMPVVTLIFNFMMLAFPAFLVAAYRWLATQ